MGTVIKRNEEIAKLGAFPVAVVSGDGMSPLRKTEMLTLRPEDQLGLPGTKTIQICTAEGRPDLPENMKKDTSWHFQSENVCPYDKADRFLKNIGE